MVAGPRSARRAAVPVAAAALLAAVAAVAVLTVPAGSPCAPGRYASSCPVGAGAITYDTLDVTVPQTGNLTNVSFAGVAFHLWSAYGGLEGTATEPDGVTVDFFTSMAAELPAGAPGAVPARPPSWISPDGTFGVAVLGSSSGELYLELEVASPSVPYAEAPVTLQLENSSRTFPTAVLVQGVSFELAGVGQGPFEAPSLYANATEPNGTGVSLRLAAGPAEPVACGAPSPTQSALLEQGVSLYAGALNDGLAVLWNGQLSVTLLVRPA